LFAAGLFVVSLAAPAARATVLMVDDGVAEDGIGYGEAHPMLVCNHFTATNGMVTDVRIDWTRVDDGALFDIGIWSDPNGDGVPSDAVLLLKLPNQQVFNANATVPHVGVFNIYDVEDTPVPASFFVGFYINTGTYPASWDSTTSQQQSWIGDDFEGIGTAVLIDSYNLSGNWLIRANLSTVPEPSAVLGTVGLICGGLLLRRRAPKCGA
jgi:hypothetical protein